MGQSDPGGEHQGGVIFELNPARNRTPGRKHSLAAHNPAQWAAIELWRGFLSPCLLQKCNLIKVDERTVFRQRLQKAKRLSALLGKV